MQTFRTGPISAVLIVLTGSLGDIARALCLPAHIKQHHPGCRISWLVESKWKPLIAQHPCIDRVIVFERSWRMASARDLLRHLRSENYEIALDLQRILKSGLLTRFSAAPRRIGFHRRNAKELNWLFNNEHIGYFSETLPKIAHYLKFTERLGLPAPRVLDFGLDPADFPPPDAIRLNPTHPYIAVVMGSSWESKNWTTEGYSQLIAAVMSRHRYGIVLLGDSGQRQQAQELAGKRSPDRIVDLVGRTSLRELVGVLAAAAAAVGPDTGTGHLAAAVGTPYVTLIGPTDAARVAPHGCEHLVVTAGADCAPCGKRQCPSHPPACMQYLGAGSVAAALERALVAPPQNRFTQD